MHWRGDDRRAIRNEVPRLCGRLMWRQVDHAIGAGARMLYGAMFDEVNEGTALFKTVTSADLVPGDGTPAGAAFLTLDADGCKLPSDWYLRLTGAAGQALRERRVGSGDLPFPLPPP